MKLLIQINKESDFNIKCDGFILGLKDYSNFTSLTFDVEEGEKGPQATNVISQ